LPLIIRTPTGKPIGSEYVTKYEPTDLPVGALKKKEKSDLINTLPLRALVKTLCAPLRLTGRKLEHQSILNLIITGWWSLH
jgi:hypothetical protein